MTLVDTSLLASSFAIKPRPQANIYMFSKHVVGHHSAGRDGNKREENLV